MTLYFLLSLILEPGHCFSCFLCHFRIIRDLEIEQTHENIAFIDKAVLKIGVKDRWNIASETS